MLEQVCDLYLRTAKPCASRTMPPSDPLADESGIPEMAALDGAPLTNVIPMSSKRLRPASIP